MKKLKALYQKQQLVQDLRKALNQAEEEFKQMCLEYIKCGVIEDSKFKLIQKDRAVRKIKDPKRFVEAVGELGWMCMSVSVQKVDALKLNVPNELVEIHTSPVYSVVKISE